ncbi:hypothetical protein FRC07_007298 [Ceratobasidium sp. 392]|nr:hypothetical protein FRC07_007298 [Ceratobasidium sp. 392]
MGWTAFAGYIALILTLPINNYLVKRTNVLQKSVSAARDLRMRAMNEAIQSIKFIKFSAWESRWISRVLSIREQELGWLRKLKVTNFLMELVWAQGPVLVAGIGFTCFTLVAKRELRAEIAFPALRILEILSQSLGILPITIASSVRTLVSLERVEKYLSEEDVPDFVSSLKRQASAPHAPVDARLGCEGGRFRWPIAFSGPAPAPKKPAPKGGWHKLLEFLRLRKSEPKPTENEGNSDEQEEQRPFELSDINVVFPEGVLSVVFGPTGCGKSSLLAAILGEMDRLEGEVYLPKEPTREIGEKGVSLSGGQKARVALARAVYARTQFVMLDDVLSAVDSHTAEHLVHRCLLGPLMKHRTVVLVTHHVELVLPAAGWVVRLRDGRIETQGHVESVRESGMLPLGRDKAKEWSGDDGDVAKHGEEEDKKASEEKKAARKLVEDEKKSIGSVKGQVYRTYLAAATYWLFGLLTVLLALDLLLQLAQKFWFKYWSESYEPKTSVVHTARDWFNFGFPSATQNVVPYLLVYIGLQVMISLANVIGQVPTIWSTLRVSRTLYDRMIRSVMRSPTRFFDTTPSGRILNRFRDLRRIESNTRSPIISSFGELINGIVTVRAFGAERDFLHSMYRRMDLTQAATHYYWMCNRWLLFRFDSLGAISVLIATIGSVQGGASPGLTGIVLIQAQTFVHSLYWGLRFWTELEQSFNSVERIQEYLDLPPEPPAVVESSRPPAAWPSATTGTLVVENLVLKYAPDLEPVLNGISFITKPSEKIGIVGRTGSGKSTLALALFRFVDPAAGRIVLDGIDITTIGLDDLRSRLTLIPQDAVLFKGTIRDNLDPFNEYTDAECLQALQRVHLPSGNTPNRSALASRAESIKDAINTAIVPDTEDQVEPRADQAGSAESSSAPIMAPEDPVSVTSRGAGTGMTVFTLETQVSEGGNNISHGQRQLLSMARALLRKSNVIVMDESTASVDFETDAKIQATIREEFGQSTLITIAHRLRTVIDNDRILVLDAGQVVEFDTPANLLKREGGLFHEMCKKSGDYDHLLSIVTRK